MIGQYWPKEAKRLERQQQRNKSVVPLARFKDKVVEIDYAVYANQEYREGFLSAGCILYLDPKTRLPMGLWQSSRKRMYLPSDDHDDWEHAKFF